MNRRDEIRKELQELGLEKLANLDHESGYGVPEGYFDQLENAILKNIPNNGFTEASKRKSLFSLRMVSSIAASLLILVIFGASFLFLNNDKKNDSFVRVSSNEYEDYLASLNDFELLKMKEYLVDLHNFEATQGFIGHDDEHLLDYLMEESNYHKFDPMTLVDLDNK